MTKREVPLFFINAFYEGKFRDSLFVVKAGGKIIEDQQALDNLVSNIRDLTRHGIKVLLIYGFGRAVDERLAGQKIDVEKHEGRRITDARTLQVIQDVVGGTMSVNVASSMARNNFEGFSFHIIPHDWMRIELRPKKPFDYGFVGHIASVENRPIARLLKITDFIACSCLGTTPEGQVLNINADTVATQIAIAAHANKLIFLSDVDGVVVRDEVAQIITTREIPGLIKDGVATGGMRVKLENCHEALQGGVKRIHLISGLRTDALKKEIYEPVGPGTMLFDDKEHDHYLNEVEAQKVLERQSNRT